MRWLESATIGHGFWSDTQIWLDSTDDVLTWLQGRGRP